RDDLDGDTAEITETSVWEVRGPGAPGAYDFSRRHAVMDAMGIGRQLVFPGFGLLGVVMYYHPSAHEFFGFDPQGVDREGLGRRLLDAHNDWAIRMTAANGADRVRHT